MSLQSFANNQISGGIFGFALAFAGVASPSVIIMQLDLTSMHMLKVFISATATSAAVIQILKSKGYASPTPSAPASLGLLGRYDGNIIGGLLLGFGMGQAGACPGTLLPQLATGNFLALSVLAGAIVGGDISNQLSRILYPRTARSGGVSKEVDRENHTVYETFSISPGTGLVLFETFCLLILGTAIWWDAEQSSLMDVLTWRNLYPIVGGLGIGVAQGASLLLRGRTLGASAVYELPSMGLRNLSISGIKRLASTVQLSCSSYLGEGLKKDLHSKSKPTAEVEDTSAKSKTDTSTNEEMVGKSTQDAKQDATETGCYGSPLPKNWQDLVAFSFGIYCGARIFTYLLPSLVFVPGYRPRSSNYGSREAVTVATGNLNLGGWLIILGSRIAGGCTSGHGISGMSMGANSSFITVAAMFAGGIFGVRILGSNWGFGGVSGS